MPSLQLKLPCSPSRLSCQHHGQRPGVAATTPGPSRQAGLTADGRLLALLVPDDRLGRLTAGPGLGIVSLRRSATCAGTPAQLPDPRAQRAGYRWATARTSPRSISGTAPSHLARPSQVRATRSRGVGAAGLPRPQVADPGRREGPWHAGSCSSAFVAGEAGVGGPLNILGCGRGSVFCFPK